MSAISRIPALIICTLSPRFGVRTTTVVSATAATSSSDWPTPTVSRITSSKPNAPRSRIASRAASDRPPRWPRAPMLRMKTLGSRACRCMRMRSPRIAPPVKGELGSVASTATEECFLRSRETTASTMVDLPVPGAPVNPATPGVLASGRRACSSSRTESSRRSTRLIARASALTSPCRNRFSKSGSVFSPIVAIVAGVEAAACPLPTRWGEERRGSYSPKKRRAKSCPSTTTIP